MITFTAEGHKQVFRAKEITKKTFDFWKNRSNELFRHVNGKNTLDDASIVDEDVHIGIYDEIEDFTVIGLELNNASLTIDNTKEKILFDLSEENLKKNKINFKIKKKNFKDICKKKKGFIFTAHEKPMGSCGPVEINKEKNFDKIKFKIEVTQFMLPASSEIKVITKIVYDKNDISWDLFNFDGDSDLPDLEVKNI